MFILSIDSGEQYKTILSSGCNSRLKDVFNMKSSKLTLHITCEPSHEKMCLVSYANNKGADQPAHPRSLISAFFVCCLDSIISLDSIAEISRLYLVSVAAQAGMCLTWSETPKDTFCHGVAHVLDRLLLL